MRKFRSMTGCVLAGMAAGAVNGTLGAGGGMLLVPLLGSLGQLEEEQVFPSSVAIILPMCIVTLLCSGGPIPWASALPYLIGSAAGGVLAGSTGRKIPTLWLHRILGLLILWGGWQYLCRQ